MYYYEKPFEEKRFGPETIKKIIICIIITAVILLMKKVNIPLAKATLAKVKYFVADYSYEFKDITDAVNNITKASSSIPVLGEKKQGLLPMPVDGIVSSEYGMRYHPILKEYRIHNGIDIVQKMGHPVKTVLDGVVMSVEQDKEMGNVVKIHHNNGMVTVYAHLKEIYVKKQELVKQGFIIGTLGDSGLTQSPHLHFEVWVDDESQDPRVWIKIPDKSAEDLDGSKNL